MRRELCKGRVVTFLWDGRRDGGLSSAGGVPPFGKLSEGMAGGFFGVTNKGGLGCS